jgi:alpha-tubulin suppressor-like RCC1 family protein
VPPDLSTVPRLVGTGFVTVAPGGVHTLAIKSDGSLWAWGTSDRGQLGTGEYQVAPLPVKVGDGYVRAASGGGFSVALRNDGSLWAWGGLPFRPQVARPEQIGSGVSEIAAGYNHVLLLQADGTLWALGYNDYGCLGDGGTTSFAMARRVGHGFTSIAAGTGLSAAIDVQGALWAWGSGDGFGMFAWGGQPHARVVPVAVDLPN